MSNFILKINNGLKVIDQNQYRAYLVPLSQGKVLPAVIPQLLDLKEYTEEFLNDINGHMTIDVNFDDRMGNHLEVMIWRKECKCALSFDLTFDELEEYDIPHLGDAIFHMWNAYVDVFTGPHSSVNNIRPNQSVMVEEALTGYGFYKEDGINV